MDMDENKSEFLFYQSEDGQLKIETRLQDESVWLSQKQMSDLFAKERSVISKHIGNVFKEGELDEKSNVQILHISGSDRPVKFYNLDVIISVGYRVKSQQGTRFRIWATQRLKEYLVKGFTMNDELLKQAGGGNYFD
ncbi:MAG: virulence RhuM family protein, partial [Lentisphaeraceae bacterium]|nr:virulence RhuM family protein [Lentisphaeraceae bacterium]